MMTDEKLEFLERIRKKQIHIIQMNAEDVEENAAKIKAVWLCHGTLIPLLLITFGTC